LFYYPGATKFLIPEITMGLRNWIRILEIPFILYIPFKNNVQHFVIEEKINMKLAKIMTIAVIALFCSSTVIVSAAVPTVNGLYYLDGDSGNYSYLGENPGRGKVYYYLDGSTLYLAVLVDPEK